MLRNWGSIIDVAPTARPSSAHADPQPRQLRLGHRGFKHTGPAVFAHTIAKGRTRINAPSLDRFRTGRLIDEAAYAAVAH
jgi:hypothetical protein